MPLNPNPNKFQGKEFNVTMGTPTQEEMEELIEGLETFAYENGLEDFEVLSLRQDPDGGWESTIRSHNWNPISWIKSKMGSGRTPAILTKQEEEELRRQQEEGLRREALPEGGREDVYEEAERLRDRTARLEEELRQEKAAREAKAKKESEERQKKGEPPTEEELLSRLTTKERKKYEEAAAEGRREEAKSRIEAARLGLSPTGETKYVRQWINQFTVPKGSTYKDPSTGQEYKEGETVPGHHILMPMKGEPLPLAELRLRAGLVEEAFEEQKSRRRARKLAPYRKVGEAGVGFAEELTGVTALGIAGVARGMQPGRGGPQRASRMLAPSVPAELYAPARPRMDLSGLRQPPVSRGLSPAGGLEGLRGLTMPTIRRPQTSPRPPITGRRIPVPMGETGSTPDISKLRQRPSMRRPRL